MIFTPIEMIAQGIAEELAAILPTGYRVNNPDIYAGAVYDQCNLHRTIFSNLYVLKDRVAIPYVGVYFRADMTEVILPDTIVDLAKLRQKWAIIYYCDAGYVERVLDTILDALMHIELSEFGRTWNPEKLFPCTAEGIRFSVESDYRDVLPQ